VTATGGSASVSLYVDRRLPVAIAVRSHHDRVTARIDRQRDAPATATKPKTVALDTQRRQLLILQHVDGQIAEPRPKLLRSLVGNQRALIAIVSRDLCSIQKRRVSAGPFASFFQAI
jgi:hypothetical protein